MTKWLIGCARVAIVVGLLFIFMCLLIGVVWLCARYGWWAGTPLVLAIIAVFGLEFQDD